MVKKIEGGKKGVGGTRGVSSSSAISGGDNVKSVKETHGVKQSGKVLGVHGTSSVNTLKNVGGEIRITPENRAQLNRVLSEETNRLFNQNMLPTKDREVLEKAIKMALDASLIIDEES